MYAYNICWPNMHHDSSTYLRTLSLEIRHHFRNSPWPKNGPSQAPVSETASGSLSLPGTEGPGKNRIQDVDFQKGDPEPPEEGAPEAPWERL